MVATAMALLFNDNGSLFVLLDEFALDKYQIRLGALGKFDLKRRQDEHADEHQSDGFSDGHTG